MFRTTTLILPKRYLVLLLISSALVLINTPIAFGSDKIDLSGKWDFSIDSTDAGIDESWFIKQFNNQIILPGTMDDAGFGIPNTLEPKLEKPQLLRLTRKNSYVGPAWYQRKLIIPKNWKNKQVQLKLERVLWESRVWINNKEVPGKQESLTTPHYFDISKYLKTGENTLTIRIDNRKKHDISVKDLAHAYTNDTQIMWNGILGEISCTAKDLIHLSNVQLFPEVDKKTVKVKIEINNTTHKKVRGDINLQALLVKSRWQLPSMMESIEINPGISVVEMTYPMGENPVLWNEFSPERYQMSVRIKDKNFESTQQEIFGMRNITAKNARLQLNNNRIFLRGTLECCIFPLTGHPLMDKAGWMKVFATAREWGLNHLRFHSWCPPEQAFEVADEMGFYLQVELPYWALTVGKDASTTGFLKSEALNIIREYGNHPSFCFWSMGNELQGDMTVLQNLVDTLKMIDGRHLYSTTSFTFEKGYGKTPLPQDEFFVTQWTDKGWVRGQGVFNTNTPDFESDYQKSIEGFRVPLITHEIGQYSVFPNIKEIDKYTGVLDPLNFKAIKADIEQKGLVSKADDYLMASGKLAAILYKEEIERAMKTPGISGFQLLDLHDFPGQGTALVGLLDAFWDSKGVTTAKEFRQACAPVVPLLRFPKATYTNDDIFRAVVELANYSNENIDNKLLKWTMTDDVNNQLLMQGEIVKPALKKGYNTDIGIIEIPLSTINSAKKITLSLSLEGTEYSNSWNIWVYPAQLPSIQTNVVYTRDFTTAMMAVNEGKDVLFNPEWEKLKGIEGKFVPVFWSPVHFPKQAETMGLLCNPEHALFNDFPTDMHTDWQWWNLLKNSKTLILDSISAVTPLIEIIDNFTSNRKLCNTFEVRIGKGRMIITSIDLSHNLDKRPVANQLRYSLTRYMSSATFNPFNTIKEEDLRYFLLPETQVSNEKPEDIY